MCSSSEPQPTNQNVTQTTIPEYAKPYVEKMLGKTEALTNAPYQAYQGERIAGFTPMQQQAQQGMANLQPAQQLGTATQLAGIGGLGSLGAGQQYQQMATNPYAMQAYMSPYVENALQPQMREAARQSAMLGQQNQAQAVQQGAFGGSRSAIVEAERQRNLAQQYGSDLGLRGFGQAGQMAGTLGQLGQTQFGQQQGIIQGQSSMGAQQQALEQQRLAQQYGDFQAQKQYPYTQLAFMSDMLRGLPLAQQAQTMYQAPPTLGQTAIGLGLGAAGLKQAGVFAEGGAVGGDTSYGLGGIALHQLG